MVDEMRVRSLASQHSLEILREYHEMLATKEQELTESMFWDTALDFGAIVAGWPIGKAAQEAIFGKATDGFFRTLVKGGFKTVDQKLAKDPSAEGVWEHVKSVSWPDEALIPEGATVDLGLEALKFGAEKVIGDVASEAMFGTLDVLKFGWAAYAGIKQQDAFRQMKNKVFDHIVALEPRHDEEIGYWTDAVNAIQYCEKLVRDRQAADANDPVYHRVKDYVERTRRLNSGPPPAPDLT
jgi:hypothetical protein